MNKIDVIRGYFDLITSFSSDEAAFLRFVHPEAEWTEFPNPVTPQTRVKGIADTLKGAQAGRKLLARQEIHIHNHFESGNQLVLEGLWTGEVGADIARFKKGQLLKAHMCIVFEFRDGKIYRQKNYDCYEPF